MDQHHPQQQQTQTAAPPTTTTGTGNGKGTGTTTTTSQPIESPQQQEQTTAPSSTPSSVITTTSPPTTNNPNPSASPSPSPNPNSAPPSRPMSLVPPPPRPTSFSRPWQPPQQHFSHFSSLPSSSSSSASPSTLASPSIPPPPRGGIAVGVPAPRPTASSNQPSPPFSSSFGQPFGGMGRSGINVPDSGRPPAMQGMGVIGSLGRPGGISVASHQQRLAVQQPSLKPPPSSPSSQSPATQNIQGQGLTRVPPVGSPGFPSPNTSQTVQSFNQPWLSSGSQGKPPLPSPSTYKSQMNTPSMQQRSHIPQQHSPLSTTSQQQHPSSVQPQQSKPSHQKPEHYGQYSSPRFPQALPHQQQIARPPGSSVQKPSSLAPVQPNTVQPGIHSKIARAESDEFDNRILSKRSIHELVNQIDPSERLDPDVEDILVDIAEDFVETITTFGCSLAKHRKSDTLEAKDILVHLERNWNMTLPGFGGDEIKTYRKPLTNDIHKERLAAIKKSVMATEVASGRTSGGQAAVSAKGNMGKMPANIVGST